MVFDVRAVRIVAERLQIVRGAGDRAYHLSRHLPDEFDDYVANPKTERLPIYSHRGACKAGR